jgi:hypothetical protein
VATAYEEVRNCLKFDKTLTLIIFLCKDYKCLVIISFIKDA